MKAGMAVRIEDADIFDEPTPTGVEDLADGTFKKLIVTGVTASMSADETAEELKRLFDTHHYTEGIELVDQWTPTNNYDTKSGYSSKDDPRESMAIECSMPTIEHGENTDGDMLARALGIDPVTTDSDEHVFAHVENADADYQTRAWHMNSALWSGTLGYYMQTMLSKFSPVNTKDIYAGGGFDTTTWTEIVVGPIGPVAGSYEASRRHFINYVRAQGPLPAFRTGIQPYGVLPAMPMSDRHANPIEKLVIADAEETVKYAQPATVEGSDSGDSFGSSIDPSVWEQDDEIRTEDGLEEQWQSMTREEFRNTYSARAARGSITDEQFARTYPAEEAATVFTKQELATHYDPESAASVLTQDELRTYYSGATLSDITAAGNRPDGEEI